MEHEEAEEELTSMNGEEWELAELFRRPPSMMDRLRFVFIIISAAAASSSSSCNRAQTTPPSRTGKV